MPVGLRASVPPWLLARGSLSSLPRGPLHRAADNMAAVFLRVRNEESEGEKESVCVMKRDTTVLCNPVSWSNIHLCLYSIPWKQITGAAHIPGEEVSNGCEQEEGGGVFKRHFGSSFYNFTVIYT